MEAVAYARTILVVVLALGLSPGLMELIEDGVHLVTDGHDDHAEGERACPEHGCAPTSHRCECCVAHPVLASRAANEVPNAPMRSHRWIEPAPHEGPRGVSRSLLRPPSA